MEEGKKPKEVRVILVRALIFNLHPIAGTGLVMAWLDSVSMLSLGMNPPIVSAWHQGLLP